MMKRDDKALAPPTPSAAPLWHLMNADAALAELKTGPAGLTAREAARRLDEYGPNALEAAHRASPWRLLLDQFKNVLIVILLAATGLSAFLGEGVETIVIGVIVVFAVGFGFIQEFRAERAIDALRKMAAPTATALRDGEELEVPAQHMVPGDIVLLQAGDRVPADVRLIESINLQIEEAALTGESVAVEKHAGPIAGAEAALGDRKNMAYAGTSVTYGRGRAVVVATGMRTEFGKIARMLQSVETERTPLQKNLDKVGHLLARVALAIVALIVALGLLRGQPFMEMLIFGVALAVAIPATRSWPREPGSRCPSGLPIRRSPRQRSARWTRRVARRPSKWPPLRQPTDKAAGSRSPCPPSRADSATGSWRATR